MAVVQTIPIFPDPQYYRTAATIAIFKSLCQWIAGEVDARKIPLVILNGDITDQDDPIWYAEILAALSVIKVPILIQDGNHDYTGAFQLRNTFINNYFTLDINPATRKIGVLRKEGWIPDAYYTYVAPDGRRMLILSLEFWPRQEAINWADQVLSMPQYKDHTVILATHGYSEEGTPVGGVGTSQRLPGMGDLLYTPLVSRHKQIVMVHCGHALDTDGLGPQSPMTIAQQSSVGAAGHTTHEICFNTQEQANGGNGWVRLYEFLDDEITIQARTYSPTLDLWLTDTPNEFQLTIPAAVPLPPASVYSQIMQTSLQGAA